MTDNVTRLTQACAASTAEVVAGSIQVFANLASDLATAVTRPMRTRRDADHEMVAEVNVVESANRAIRDLADVVGRSQQQFSDAFRHETADDIADRADSATQSRSPDNTP
ncbi:hypothetical protein [Bradyrhizobium sp. SZCCHNRI1009]|uniref:hypothetical protein n=1 Tax=Bradyrhizobium sp. SZCCHNRI1009 TaxID=3057277 RepID=UPI0029165515|nr:hypothetical protein [Bradyrhizobium sp. SZCCHNRI1009]